MKRGTDNDEGHGEPDHLSATKNVTNGEVEDAAKESTQAIAGHGDTDDDIARVVELSQPVFVFEQTTEHTLIVPEE